MKSWYINWIKCELAAHFACLPSELDGQNIYDCLAAAEDTGEVEIYWGTVTQYIAPSDCF